jgi:hypothetical protein
VSQFLNESSGPKYLAVRSAIADNPRISINLIVYRPQLPQLKYLLIVFLVLARDKNSSTSYSRQ